MVDCKICEHPYCEHAGTQRGIVLDCANYMPRQKPQTNADRYRAMSDEELARTFAHTGNCPPSSKYGYNCVSCGECWLDYLRQPVKDGDNG